jgi:hypothetical protein
LETATSRGVESSFMSRAGRKEGVTQRHRFYDIEIQFQ